MNSDLSKLEDRELVELCVRRNERALIILHTRHGDVCQRRAFNVLRHTQLAEEAVQDAFLTFWRTAATFDADRSQVRTWLCVLVHRRAVDTARREARHHLDEADHATPDPASYTAEELLLLQIDRRRVRAAVDRLEPRHRQMIDLAYWGGLSQSQIAARCGIPPGTVKSRTFEALALLSRALRAGDAAPALRARTA